MSRQADDRLEGFTLVEMLVVLAILALTAAIAAPRFMRDRTNLAEAVATQVKQALHFARLAAISRGDKTDLVIDLERRTFVIDRPHRVISIPKGVSASATVGRDAQTTTTHGTISFFPDGSSTGAVLRFEASGKKVVVLTLSWLTGGISEGRHEP